MIFDYEVVKMVDSEKRYGEWKSIVIKQLLVNFVWVFVIGLVIGMFIGKFIL